MLVTCHEYAFVSAKTGKNIEEVFSRAIKAKMMKHRKSVEKIKGVVEANATKQKCLMM